MTKLAPKLSKLGPKLAKSSMTGMAPPAGPQASQHGSYQALQGFTRQGVSLSKAVLKVVVKDLSHTWQGKGFLPLWNTM